MAEKERETFLEQANSCATENGGVDLKRLMNVYDSRLQQIKNHVDSYFNEDPRWKELSTQLRHKDPYGVYRAMGIASYMGRIYSNDKSLQRKTDEIDSDLADTVGIVMWAKLRCEQAKNGGHLNLKFE